MSVAPVDTCVQIEPNIFYNHNGRESTVNRSLDDSIYRG
jgi:hypothetical protein